MKNLKTYSLPQKAIYLPIDQQASTLFLTSVFCCSSWTNLPNVEVKQQDTWDQEVEAEAAAAKKEN